MNGPPERILLLVDQARNRRLLASHLCGPRTGPDPEEAGLPPQEAAGPGERTLLEGPLHLADEIDLVVTDAPALAEHLEAVQEKKRAERPRFLPVLLLAGRKDIGLATRHLWQAVDELLFVPLQRLELSARVEVLLRARRDSVLLARRNEDLKTFLYLLSHDLRAPLRAVSGLSEALVEDYAGGLPPEAADYVRRIQRAFADMDALVSQVTDFLRLEAQWLSLGPVDLGECVASVLSELEAAVEATGAAVTVAPRLPTVEGSRLFLQGIFRNLLSNALKYVRPGETPRVHVGWEPCGPGVRVFVRDNGPGIPPGEARADLRAFQAAPRRRDGPGGGPGPHRGTADGRPDEGPGLRAVEPGPRQPLRDRDRSVRRS